MAISRAHIAVALSLTIAAASTLCCWAGVSMPTHDHAQAVNGDCSSFSAVRLCDDQSHENQSDEGDCSDCGLFGLTALKANKSSADGVLAPENIERVAVATAHAFDAYHPRDIGARFRPPPNAEAYPA